MSITSLHIDSNHLPVRFYPTEFEVVRGFRVNSSGMHLKVAEWILQRSEATCIYDVVKQFGLTALQAAGILSSIMRDGAINAQTGFTKLECPPGRYSRKYVRTVLVLSMDWETISQRKTANRHYYYQAEHHLPEKTSEMSTDEKWEWLLKNGRRFKHR